MSRYLVSFLLFFFFCFLISITIQSKINQIEEENKEKIKKFKKNGLKKIDQKNAFRKENRILQKKNTFKITEPQSQTIQTIKKK